MIKGHTWDYLKQNAMANNPDERRGEWWVSLFNDQIKGDDGDMKLLGELKEA